MASSLDEGKQSIEEVEKNSDHPNKEGTLYQSELGPKAKRKHFFSPLDAAYAQAVHKDAEFVEFTPEEEVHLCTVTSMTLAELNPTFQRAVRKKIDCTVLPLVVCRFGYCFAARLCRN